MEKLKTLLEAKKNNKNDQKNLDNPVQASVIIATKTDRFGNEIPLTRADLQSDDQIQPNKRHKKVKKVFDTRFVTLKTR